MKRLDALKLLTTFIDHLHAGRFTQAKEICQRVDRTTLIVCPTELLTGKSFIYCALIYKQWDIVEVLLDKKAITSKIMNCFTANGNGQISVATILASDPQGLKYLCANNFALAELISEEHLNFRLLDQEQDMTVAYRLASSSEGLDILGHLHDLGKRISAQNLNHIITTCPYPGESLAFMLARNFKGRTLLQNLIASGVFINQTALNAVIASPVDNISLACMLLSSLPTHPNNTIGLLILDKLHEHGVTIDANCLNAATNHGYSPAFFLACDQEYGHKILIRLATLGVYINYEILNKRLHYAAGFSVAAVLLFSYSASAAELFKIQDFALARKIDIKCLLPKIAIDLGPSALQEVHDYAKARKHYCILFTEMYKHDQTKDLTAPDALETHPIYNARTMLHLKKIQALPVAADAEPEKTAYIKAGWQRCVARAL